MLYFVAGTIGFVVGVLLTVLILCALVVWAIHSDEGVLPW